MCIFDIRRLGCSSTHIIRICVMMAPAPATRHMYSLAKVVAHACPVSSSGCLENMFVGAAKNGLRGGGGREGIFEFSPVTTGQPPGFQPHSTPCTGISTQPFAVYRKPPRRGRIHFIQEVAAVSSAAEGGEKKDDEEVFDLEESRAREEEKKKDEEQEQQPTTTPGEEEPPREKESLQEKKEEDEGEEKKEEKDRDFGFGFGFPPSRGIVVWTLGLGIRRVFALIPFGPRGRESREAAETR